MEEKWGRERKKEGKTLRVKSRTSSKASQNARKPKVFILFKVLEIQIKKWPAIGLWEEDKGKLKIDGPGKKGGAAAKGSPKGKCGANERHEIRSMPEHGRRFRLILLSCLGCPIGNRRLHSEEKGIEQFFTTTKEVEGHKIGHNEDRVFQREGATLLMTSQ